MNTVNYDQAALFEQRFWLQILGDHARFLFTTLSPAEVEAICTANHFIHVFDQLLESARHDLSHGEILQLNQQACLQAAEIRNFKLSILARQLEGDISINLPPTFINHMVNEVDEYLRIAQSLVAEQLPPACHPLHYHLVWLPDAAGHANTIASLSDPVEKPIIARGNDFAQQFEDFYIKATELAGYLRTNVERFPALARFNHEVDLEIRLFSRFLEEIEELDLDARLLGALSPLMPDHMAREECYYLLKLASVSEVDAPDCDPTKPRVEG